MGSVVWAAIDVASGAAFAYPERITVPLKAAAAAAAGADDPQSKLAELERLRAEYRISAMEYQLRLAELQRSGQLGAAAGR